MCEFLLGVFCTLMVAAQARMIADEKKMDVQPFTVTDCESGGGMSSFTDKYPKFKANTHEEKTTEGINSPEDCAQLCKDAETACLGFDYSDRSDSDTSESTMSRRSSNSNGNSKSCWLISDPEKLNMQEADEDTTFYVRKGCKIEKTVQDHLVKASFTDLAVMNFEVKLSLSTDFSKQMYSEPRYTVSDCESGGGMSSFTDKYSGYKANTHETEITEGMKSIQDCAQHCKDAEPTCLGFDYSQSASSKSCWLISDPDKLDMKQADEDTTFYVRAGCKIEKTVQDRKIKTEFTSFAATSYIAMVDTRMITKSWRPSYTVVDCESGGGMSSFTEKYNGFKVNTNEEEITKGINSPEDCAQQCKDAETTCVAFDYKDKSCFLVSDPEKLKEENRVADGVTTFHVRAGCKVQEDRNIG